MAERIAIIDGLRTPMCKSGGAFKNIEADDLGAYVVKELVARTELPLGEIDEFIFGNVSHPVHAANISRVIALKSSLPTNLIAHTISRNCSSGMDAITSGIEKMLCGEAKVILAGGTESMSNIPLLYNKEMTNFFLKIFRAKTFPQRLGALFSFRPRFLKPVVGLTQGLTDPISGLIMGLTAEVLSREFLVTREEQDEFALRSHQKACQAIQEGRLAEEIVPVVIGPDYKKVQYHDDGPRPQQTIEALRKLKPYFDRRTGSVTVGNSCQVTDSAAAVFIMRESKAKSMGYKPLGYVRGYAYAALEPHRMGLGPAYATAKLLEKTNYTVKDFDLIELNEAFATQVIANERAFASDAFAKTYLSRSKALGEIDPDRLNVNGGAIALGHPVGMTGTRLVITLIKELRRQNKNLGLATLCVGGGQGGAMALEVES